MKRKSFDEVQKLIREDTFLGWFHDLKQTRLELQQADRDYLEFLSKENLESFLAELVQKDAIDTLYRAGDYEDEASALIAEAGMLENASLEAVAGFETLRMETSEKWISLEAIEHFFEEKKDELNQLLAYEKKGNNVSGDIKKLKAEFKKLEEIVTLKREEYRISAAKRDATWKEVENRWNQSFVKDLTIRERFVYSKKERKRSELLFQKAEQHKKHALEYKVKINQSNQKKLLLEEKNNELLRMVESHFHAVALKDFLFWQQKENDKYIFVVPLITDFEYFNMEIEELKIYQADRKKGIELIEPYVSTIVQNNDPRLVQFFRS